MNKKFEEDFLNYLEQTLSTDESREFEQQLAVDKSLAKKFENYRQIVQMENQISQETVKLDEQFVSNVMAKIDKHESVSNIDDKPSFLRKIVMEITKINRTANRRMYAGLATCAVMVLCVALLYGPEYQVYKESRSSSTETSGTSSVVVKEPAKPLPLKALEEVHPQEQQLKTDQDALISSKITRLESKAAENVPHSARDIVGQKVQKQALLAKPQAMQRNQAEPLKSVPVSYTHLTLPTICSV